MQALLYDNYLQRNTMRSNAKTRYCSRRCRKYLKIVLLNLNFQDKLVSDFIKVTFEIRWKYKNAKYFISFRQVKSEQRIQKKGASEDNNGELCNYCEFIIYY